MKEDNQIQFNTLQKVSIALINSDLRFIYTIHQNYTNVGGNFFVALFPYLGLVTDGAEDWLKAYNNSSKMKLNVPLFNKEQQSFFEKMRSSIKIWEQDYDLIYQELGHIYKESDDYFSSLCKPIAKQLHLYDIFGAYIANHKYCGNTVLCNYYIPDYKFGNDHKDLLINMGSVTGEYIALFGAKENYTFNSSFTNVYDRDYGGFIKSPVGNKYSDKFVLFSILCQINFVLEGINKTIIDETPTKLRFSYLLYYYLLKILPQINKKFRTDFKLSDKWCSGKFRNAMAHYKMGIALRENEIVFDDPLYGLTQKYLGTDYYTVKNDIIELIEKLASQLDDFLGFNGKIK